MFGAAPTATTLVNHPDAIAFLEKAGMKTGRKVLLGDPQRYDGRALNAINEAHAALEGGVNKIADIVKDETRRHNPVLQHEAAEQVANRVVATLERSQASLAKLATTIDGEYDAAVAEGFALRSGRDTIHAEMRAFIKETAKKEDGLREIRSIIAKDREAAAVVVNSPAWLMGLADDAHSGLMGEALKHHLAQAGMMLAQAQELANLAAKYPAVIGGVRRSFYTTAIADKSRTRVEV